jgi:hypothetical protein
MLAGDSPATILPRRNRVGASLKLRDSTSPSTATLPACASEKLGAGCLGTSGLSYPSRAAGWEEHSDTTAPSATTQSAYPKRVLERLKSPTESPVVSVLPRAPALLAPRVLAAIGADEVADLLVLGADVLLQPLPQEHGDREGKQRAA